MIDLITLDEAKQHLRVTSIHADGDIQSKIMQASAILFDYIKVDIDTSPLSVPWGDAAVPFNIKAACALIMAELYYNREAKEADVLSPTVKSLLHRKRTPALA